MSISEFRSPIARQFEDEWMRALASVAAMTEDELPPKRKPVQPGAIPEPRQWARIDEASAARLGTVRSAVASVASGLGLAPEVVLAPQVQRYLAWAPLDPSRPSGDEVEERMVARGARRLADRPHPRPDLRRARRLASRAPSADTAARAARSIPSAS